MESSPRSQDSVHEKSRCHVLKLGFQAFQRLALDAWELKSTEAVSGELGPTWFVGLGAP